MIKYNTGRVTNEQIRTFESRLGNEMKRMTSDGWFPGSPLFPLGKINAVIKICKDLNLNIEFDKAADRIIKLRRIPLFKNYKFLLFLTRLYYLKDYFKQYTVVDGHKFWSFPSKKMMDIIRDYQALKTVWEPETTALVKKHVKEGQTCVDIGASVGYFTLLFARQVGSKGKVISIEPTDFQQPYRKRNVKVNGYNDRVILIEAGAWDKDEVIKMPRNAPPYVQTELRCRPVDDMLEELGITEVDFIKIDVDGPEPKVLKGLERTIKRSPNLKMVIEYYPKYIKDAGLNPQDMLDLLTKYFIIEVIPGDYEDGCWNYFCVRKQ